MWGWWLAAGKVLADSYGVTTASSLALTKVVSTGFLITLGGTALMLLPAVVTRLFPLPVRESLDGFVIGAFGALWYQTAATATTLAPQFAEGLMLEQSATRILADSLTYGVVTRSRRPPPAVRRAQSVVPAGPAARHNPGRARAALTICTVVAVGLYVTVWAVDSLSLSRMADVSLQVGGGGTRRPDGPQCGPDRPAPRNTRSGHGCARAVCALRGGGSRSAVLLCVWGRGAGVVALVAPLSARESPARELSPT